MHWCLAVINKDVLESFYAQSGLQPWPWSIMDFLPVTVLPAVYTFYCSSFGSLCQGESNGDSHSMEKFDSSWKAAIQSLCVKTCK